MEATYPFTRINIQPFESGLKPTHISRSPPSSPSQAKATIGRGYGDCWPEPLGAAGAPAPGSAGALATATARALGAAQSRKQDKKVRGRQGRKI